MAGPKLGKDEAGHVWELDGQGNPVRLHAPAQSSAIGQPIGGNPLIPGQLQGQSITNEKNSALTPYEIRAAKADAAKKELDLRNAQDAYNSAHPKGSTATVLGPDSLKKLSAPDQEIVKALAEGRLAFPGGFALKAPFWQQKLEQVAAYDPAFDATNFNNRAKARAMLLTGKVGTSANALNTAIGHAGLLENQIAGTASHGGDHSWLPFATTLNSIINSFEQGKGDSGITNFKDTAGKLAAELTSVYRNGGGAEADVVRALQSLDPNASRDQKEAVIRNTLDLLASKQAANLHQYGLGGGKPEVDLLDPDARKILDKFPDIRDKHFDTAPAPAISGAAAALIKANGGTPPPAGPTATGPNGTDPNGGLDTSLATGADRKQYDPITSAGLNALIHKGAPYQQALAYAQSQGYHGLDADPNTYAARVAYAHDHPDYQAATANKTIPTSFGQRLASSAPAAALVGSMGGATAGLSDVVGRALDGPQWDANRAALSGMHPTADLLGNVAGGAAGMFAGGSALSGLARAGAKGGIARDALALALKNPKTAGVLGDTAYGAAYGANESPDNPLAGAGVGALGGLGGGIAGNALAAGTGAALRGVVNPAVDRLRAAGIPLTVGEVLGGGAKKAQDAMTSVFGPGNMVARRYNDGRTAMNAAAFNQAGDIVGQPINATGHAGIQALDAAKSGAYAKALNPISLNLNDPQAIQGIGGALNAAKAIPNVDQASDVAKSALQNYIGNAAPNGVMNGTDFQQAYRGLSRTANRAGDRIYGHEIGQALGQGQDALVSALETQHPGAYADFLKANSANRHLSVLTDAVNAAKNQIGDNGQPLFTPAQLGTAATSNARTYSGKVAAASGNRPFNQLATDAQQIMSSRLPESGTFPRALMGYALTGGLSGAGGMFGGQANGAQGAAEGAFAPLAMLSLMGTRRGQKLLTDALLKRPNAFRTAGQALQHNTQFGGDILTAAGIPLLTGP